MPDEEKKVKEPGKEKSKGAEDQRESTSKELTREQLEALRRKLLQKFR